MNIKYGKLDVKRTCGERYVLTEVAPVYNYADGKRIGEPVAYNYTVVLPDRKFEQLRVRIDGMCAIEVPEEPSEVDFVELSLDIKWSKTEGNYIAGTATSIAIA